MDAAEIAALVVLVAVFAVLTVIDVRHKLLPNVIVYPGIVAAAIAAPILPADGYLTSLAAGAASFGVFLAVYILVPTGGFGGGDVKLAAMIGLALGLENVLLAYVVMSLVVIAVVVPMLLARRWSLRTKIAYGPYMCIGAGVAAIAASV